MIKIIINGNLYSIDFSTFYLLEEAMKDDEKLSEFLEEIEETTSFIAEKIMIFNT